MYRSVLRRVWLLWAISLTAISAVATVRLVRLRVRLMSSLQALKQQSDQAPLPRLTFRCSTRLQLQMMACSLCALLEGTFGWITGSAWSTGLVQVFYSLEEYPTLVNVVYNIAISFGASVLAMLWILYLADDPFDVTRKTQRSYVERFFMTNAMTFFVGWSYIVWMRGLVVNVRNMLLDANYADWGTFGEIVTVIFFGPVMTVLLVRSKVALFGWYSGVHKTRSVRAPIFVERDGARGYTTRATMDSSSLSTQALSAGLADGDGVRPSAGCLQSSAEAHCERPNRLQPQSVNENNVASVFASHKLDFAPVVSLALTGINQDDLMREPLMQASDPSERHHEDGVTPLSATGTASADQAMLDGFQMSRVSFQRQTIG